jgi:homoserine dehydrogenase
MRFADELGYKIKLLGRSRTIGEKVAAYVAPHLIGKDNLLAGVEGVMNGVVVRGNAVGNVIFFFFVAGKMPTASAVVADVIDSVKHLYARKWISWADGGADLTADPILLESAWYIRTSATREKVARVFGEVVFAGKAGGATAFKTAVMSGRIVGELMESGISALSMFRVLGDH